MLACYRGERRAGRKAGSVKRTASTRSKSSRPPTGIKGPSKGSAKRQGAPPISVLKRVALVVFDFDGVMTDNRVLVMQDGSEGVMCNRSDGLGVGMLHASGVPMLVLSKEQNPVVSARCRKLKVECLQGIDDKIGTLTRIAAERGIEIRNIAYVGNDLNDVECMRAVGVPIAVADAWPVAMRVARYVTSRLGGHGAVREVCDWILSARNA